jgi:hypothetical protein
VPNTVKVASNTSKITKPKDANVRNSNSALDYRIDEIRLPGPSAITNSTKLYPLDGLAQKQQYGHSQRFQTASGKLLVFNGN